MINVVSTMIEAHIFREKNNELEFLLLKRAAGEIFEGVWQMVTGRVESGEKAHYSALREIKEETGLEPLNFWIVPTVNSFYSSVKNHINMVPVFAAFVTPEQNVQISEEHDEYIWCSKESAKKLLAWEGQRKAVDIISEYFLNNKSFLNFVEIPLRDRT